MAWKVAESGSRQCVHAVEREKTPDVIANSSLEEGGGCCKENGNGY